MGGRWNPKDLFAAIYLAIPQTACMAELDRVAESQNVPAATMLQVPYKFHTLEVDAARILDLSSTERLSEIGLEAEDISDPDWSACQMVGHAAWFLRFQGILAPSASGTGMVLTLFESRLGPGSVLVKSSDDLTLSLYEELSRFVE